MLNQKMSFRPKERVISALRKLFHKTSSTNRRDANNHNNGAHVATENSSTKSPATKSRRYANGSRIRVCDFRFGSLFAKCRSKTEISHCPKSNLDCSHTMKETFFMVSITFHMHLKQWYIAEHKSKIRE